MYNFINEENNVGLEYLGLFYAKSLTTTYLHLFVIEAYKLTNFLFAENCWISL